MNYSGVREVNVDESLIAELHQEGHIVIDEELSPNEFVILRPGEGKKPTIARHFTNGLLKTHHIVNSILPARNKEQSWAYELLYDESVKLVTLTGYAGTGKTLLALAAGMHQLDKGVYSKLIVTRPIVPLGKDLGHLPGTLEEKMDPWIAPIRDNMQFVFGRSPDGQQVKAKSARRRQYSRNFQSYLADGLIEIQAVAYVRGRSLPKSYIVIDESQNLDSESIKTLITRAGDGTKIVMTGDIDQIDSRTKSGLLNMIEKFKPHSIAGHINLIKGERSELATLAAKIL